MCTPAPAHATLTTARLTLAQVFNFLSGFRCFESTLTAATLAAALAADALAATALAAAALAAAALALGAALLAAAALSQHSASPLPVHHRHAT